MEACAARSDRGECHRAVFRTQGDCQRHRLGFFSLGPVSRNLCQFTPRAVKMNWTYSFCGLAPLSADAHTAVIPAKEVVAKGPEKKGTTKSTKSTKKRKKLFLCVCVTLWLKLS